MACQKITESEYVEQKMNTHNELVNIGKELALREHEKRMKTESYLTAKNYLKDIDWDDLNIKLDIMYSGDKESIFYYIKNKIKDMSMHLPEYTKYSEEKLRESMESEQRYKEDIKSVEEEHESTLNELIKKEEEYDKQEEKNDKIVAELRNSLVKKDFYIFWLHVLLVISNFITFDVTYFGTYSLTYNTLYTSWTIIWSITYYLFTTICYYCEQIYTQIQKIEL